ncbi:MAG: beta-lactamase family protein [Gemmatimonadetes bacterium]|nr:beta-lactamase family protein [Gemmatimonadota bacterium]
MHLRPSLRALALLFGLAALPAAVHAQHIIGERDARALRADSVFRRFDRSDAPGCALGVYQDGGLLYARGYGMASLEHGIALSPRSVLDVGSISKQFTAMSILLLQRDGKLSLDDPIRKLFPEMPAYADGITWRRALSQTSGLRDLWTLWGQTGRTFRGDTIDALQVITRSAGTNYAPGDRYLYTNSGWILAAQAVYRLTGKSLAQFAESRIFAPLGMRDTRYFGDNAMVIPGLATAYSPQTSGGFRVARTTYDGAIVGAGGVHTTIEDFGRWLDNYDRLLVGDAAIVRTMTTPTALSNGSPARSDFTLAYAVGLNAGTFRGLPVVSHGGSWAGYRGHFLRFPEQRFAVATFCNVANAGADTLARQVAGVYLGDRMAPDTVGAWVAALDAAPAVTVPASDRQAIAGIWRNVARGVVQRIRLAGDTIIAVGSERTRVIPLGGGRFRLGRGTELRLAQGDAGRLLSRSASDTATYERVDSVALTAAQLAEYAGEYRNEEIETTHSWRVEKGALVVYAAGRRLGTVDPTYRDGFVRSGAVIDVTRDARGRITGFVLQSGRVRDLRFTRLPK